MWYFAWILGLGFACSFAVLNAIWLELHLDEKMWKANKPSESSKD